MTALLPRRIDVIDSHSAGEPTRCVLPFGLDLGAGTVAQRLEVVRARYDAYRRALLCEPRGSDVLVGAYLLEPSDPSCATGVIYFNNAGYLGMCGHGTMGLVATLSHMGRIKPGTHRIETPVGVVEASLAEDGEVSFRNVPAFRLRAAATVEVPGYGTATGDIAWGGNWFFLIKEHGFSLSIDQVGPLTDFTWAVRHALASSGIAGTDGAEIDHVELFGPAFDSANHSRNFVICPGKAYDRSPCGTGTSAKLACLAADGHLAPGDLWHQEGILGTVFTGSYEWDSQLPGRILPTIRGSAHITAETALIFSQEDPFQWGVPE